jgi:Protein of unknown function (DUF998)
MENAIRTKPASDAGSAPLAARVAFGAAAFALVTLALLHPLRPDLSPPAHMISEYAVGPWGWVMTLCFAAFATSSGSVLVLGWSRVKALGRVGLVFLAFATIGLALAVVFPIDPTATSQETMSLSGRMHGVGFMVGVPGQLFAVLLLTIALRKPALTVLAAGVWMSLVLMAYAIVTSGMHPGDPPHGWFGIPNRTFMSLYAAWLAVTARTLASTSD